MAVIVPTNESVNGYAASTVTTMTAADTLTFKAEKTQLLQFRNTTASPVVVTIDGDGAAAVSVPGTGKRYDTTTGMAITVAANGTGAVVLKSIREFCKGTVAVTGGVGLTAVLYEF